MPVPVVLVEPDQVLQLADCLVEGLVEFGKVMVPDILDRLMDQMVVHFLLLPQTA